MLILLLLLVLAAGVAPWVARGRPAVSRLLALVPLGAGVSLAFLASRPTESYAWAPALGVRLSFSLDGLGLLFGFLICGIGVVVFLYAASYLEDDPRRTRFFPVLVLFTLAMLGLVLADNILALFIFWELTSLTSFLLIGYDHERPAARDAALQTLLVTGLGGLALLAGLLLLASAGGSFELSALLTRGDVLRQHTFYTPAVLLIALGAFTKSAQFPFHFWLPAAMEAPTPVSAFLHSATMVKAGVYLLARLSPALGGTPLWTELLTVTGGVTMLLGFLGAFPQRDAKRMLAYSTIGALGMLTMLIGVGTPAALHAALAVLLAHALYKASLFLLAGTLDHATGTRDINEWRGLWAAMPTVAVATVLAAASLAGLPPLFGYVVKEQLLSAAWSAPGLALPVTLAVFTAGAFSVAVAGMIAVRPLAGPPAALVHAPPRMLWAGPAALAALGVVLGAFPELADRWLVLPAAAAVAGRASSEHLMFWHGFGVPLLVSAVTLLAGAALYRRREPALAALGRFRGAALYGPARAYSAALDAVFSFARAQTAVLQSGKLRNYILIVLLVTAVTGFHALAAGGGAAVATDWMDLRLHEAVLGIIMVTAVVAALVAESRLAAVAALGVVGLVVALVFLLFGAPDLAITQFLVETLTVILLVLVLYHLPRFARLSTAPRRFRDLAIALSAGALVTSLVLGVASVQPDPAVSAYYAEHSVPLAHGRNIVNVILVDFRALDTLGEITVLAVAAVGVHGLLKLRLKKGGSL